MEKHSVAGIDRAVCPAQVLRGEKAECPNTFPEAPCYFLDSQSKYYSAHRDKKSSFEDADRECGGRGGRLVEINSPEEHWLLSSLATREGSWIGLSLNKSSDPFIWRWVTTGCERPRQFAVAIARFGHRLFSGALANPRC